LNLATHADILSILLVSVSTQAVLRDYTPQLSIDYLEQSHVLCARSDFTSLLLILRNPRSEGTTLLPQTARWSELIRHLQLQHPDKNCEQRGFLRAHRIPYASPVIPAQHQNEPVWLQNLIWRQQPTCQCLLFSGLALDIGFLRMSSQGRSPCSWQQPVLTLRPRSLPATDLPRHEIQQRWLSGLSGSSNSHLDTLQHGMKFSRDGCQV